MNKKNKKNWQKNAPRGNLDQSSNPRWKIASIGSKSCAHVHLGVTFSANHYTIQNAKAILMGANVVENEIERKTTYLVISFFTFVYL